MLSYYHLTQAWTTSMCLPPYADLREEPFICTPNQESRISELKKSRTDLRGLENNTLPCSAMIRPILRILNLARRWKS